MFVTAVQPLVAKVNDRSIVLVTPTVRLVMPKEMAPPEITTWNTVGRTVTCKVGQ